MNSDIIQKHYFISGRVQGVGYRYFAQKAAKESAICGWVRNLPDLRVELVAQGKKADFENFEQKLREGPALSFVKDLQINIELIGDFTDFQILV